MELSQSKTEQRDYLKNVELARVLDKRAKRKGVDVGLQRPAADDVQPEKKRKIREPVGGELDDVLSRIF
jgi:ESF2/ABP1 family protein